MFVSYILYNKGASMMHLCYFVPQMVQVNAQVGFFVDQHVAGGIRRRIEMLVRSDRTAVKGLVHVQGNLFHVNEFLRIMSALHPKEQRELTLFRNRGTGIPKKTE